MEDTASNVDTTRLIAPGWLAAGLAALIAAWFLGAVAMRTPAARGADAPADEFSAARALPVLERIMGDGEPHVVGTPANAVIRGILIGEFEALGYEVELQEILSCRGVFLACGFVSNLMTRLPGSGDGRAVALVAHYDTVGAGPGAADDMASVAIVLEVARILASGPTLANDVIFLLTDGEEAGLLGAQAFVDHHPWAREVDVVVNMEARGTRGQSLLFETSRDNAWLVRAFAREAPHAVASSLLSDMYRVLPNDTDFTVFLEAGMSGVNFAFAEGVGHYHTPLDNLDLLSRDSLQHQGDNALAAVRAFGGAELGAPSPASALYHEILPGRLVMIRAGWAVPLGVICLIVWLVLAAFLARAGATSLASILTGLTAALSGLILGGAVALGAAELIVALTGSPAPWNAVPLPTRIAVWAGAAAGMTVAGILFARRAGFWGATIATWLLWTIMATLLAAELPGTSIVFLLPLLAATAVFAITGLIPSLRAGAPLAAVAVAFFAAYIWFPLALSVEFGMGFELAVGIGLCVGLALTAILPLLAARRTEAGTQRWLLITACAATAVGIFGAMRAPHVSELWPERMNLVHFEDVGPEGARARWLAAPSVSPDLPAALRTAAAFSAEREAVIPWTGLRPYAAPAPALNSAPDLVIESDTVVAGERVVTLRLVSPREPFRFVLQIPQSVPLREVRFGDALPLHPERTDPDGSWSLICSGTECAGLELELRLGGTAAFDVRVIDFVAGLPAGGEALLAARPAMAVPSHEGDVSVSLALVTIPAR